MTIRRAVEKDVDKICELLSQVLEIHAKIRPDIFISGTTKYTHDELVEMFKDDEFFTMKLVYDGDELKEAIVD